MDCVWIGNKSRLLCEFYGFGGVVHDVQSVHESRKNGVNCIRNVLIRAIGSQSVHEAEF